MHPESMRLDRAQAAVLVIDIQERLLAAIAEDQRPGVLRGAALLIQGAGHLGLPVLVTEQYPRGLGPTAEPVRAALPAAVRPIEKTHFSCLGAPAVQAALQQLGRRQILLCGMESHVCVYQTARDLLAAGHAVFVVKDAVASRTAQNLQVGLSLMERAGAVLTSVEAALFDLLGCAGTAEFKAISALVK